MEHGWGEAVIKQKRVKTGQGGASVQWDSRPSRQDLYPSLSLLQVRKCQLREMDSLVRGHTARTLSRFAWNGSLCTAVCRSDPNLAHCEGSKILTFQMPGQIQGRNHISSTAWCDLRATPRSVLSKYLLSRRQPCQHKFISKASLTACADRRSRIPHSPSSSFLLLMPSLRGPASLIHSVVRLRAPPLAQAHGHVVFWRVTGTYHGY